MDNKYLEIVLDSYGFTFSIEAIYFSISWLGLGVIVLMLTARKIYKIKRGK
jgi:hypothetical protein